MVIIVMGVSGCGKTTVGKKLANQLNLPFYDADDFHPLANVEKMSSGKPLKDDDREPWLKILSKKIDVWNRNKGAVLACSALKLSYRQLLASKSEHVQFVHLKGDRDTLLKRLKAREAHYMPPDLLDSQFEALEEPKDAITVSAHKTPQVLVREIVNHPNLLHLS